MRRIDRDSVDRRSLLKGALAGVAGAALPLVTRQGFAADELLSTQITPELTLLSGAGGNILSLATNDGQVVVDSGATEFKDAVVTALGTLPGDKVTAVFNTHWHLDQVGANEVLGEAGATIYSHEKTRLRLSTGYYLPAEDRYESALPAAGRPTETTYTTDTVNIAGQRIDYGYLIEAHTDGDIFVSFPDHNVIAVGDVVSPQRDPVFDWFGGGWLGGRVDALALLLAQSDAETRFVPSYGPALGRAQVQSEHDMMLELFERMVEHVRLGETADDMLAEGVLDRLGRSFADPRRLLYDLHKGFWAHHNKLMHDIV